jgi:serine/threonine protein kinase
MTRRAVAMKFLLTTGREPELRARLVREAAAAGMLDHPNVVRVFDVFDFEDGSPVVVMELLVGETLADKLAREGPLGLEETARLLLPVISAVGAAHALGVVHRDLKPANVFLTTSGAETRVKVLDFGLAKLAQSPSAISAITDLRTATGRVLGSPGYMAPEQVEGAHVDPSMDVWSTGVILYECLSGIRPIEGSNLVEIRERLLHDGIIPIEELMPELPRDVSDLVSRMLSRDPGRRLQGFVEIGELLRRHASPRAPSDSSLRIARG